MNKVKIRIKGKNPKYFLGELIRRNINIYDLIMYSDKLDIIVSENDYKDIVEMKTSYEIIILDYYGLLKVKKIVFQNHYYLFFIFIGIIINLLLSQMIFKVEIDNPNRKIANKLLSDLEDMGIKKYHFKVGYKKKNIIKNKILEKDRDFIEWIEIEEVGTVYKVKFEERKKNKKEVKCEARNIIAGKNAIITRIEAEDGEVIKNKNDYVLMGDTIISGLIHNKEEIVSKKCARGRVFGEVWYSVKVILPKERIVRKVLSDNKNSLYIEFFSFKKSFRKLYRNYKKTEYNIIGSSFLPIKVGIGNYHKVVEKTKKYSLDRVDNISLGIANNKMKKEIKSNDKILLKKVLKKSVKNSKIEVVVFFKVEEDITDYFNIENIDIEEINQKKE